MTQDELNNLDVADILAFTSSNYSDGGTSAEDMFDFGAGYSIADGLDSGKEIGFTLQNSTGGSQTVALLSGPYGTTRAVVVSATPDIAMVGGTAVAGGTAGDVVIFEDNPAELYAAGFPVTAVLDNNSESAVGGIIYKDATGDLTVTYEAEKSPRSFREQFRAGGSAHIVETHISSTDASFFSKKLTIDTVSAFESPKREYVTFTSAYRPSNNLNDKIIVERDYVLSSATVVYVTIPKNATVSFNMYASLESNSANLVKKVVARQKKAMPLVPVTKSERLASRINRNVLNK